VENIAALHNEYVSIADLRAERFRGNLRDQNYADQDQDEDDRQDNSGQNRYPVEI
jgi:hypothetical protein